MCVVLLYGYILWQKRERKKKIHHTHIAKQHSKDGKDHAND
jgi:hypothetical protein